MIRLGLFGGVVLGLAVYAWRDWYKSLCGLVLLMAIIERPDMPRSLPGLRGVTPWNLLLLTIVLAWAFSRRREGLRWDMPASIALAFLAYVTVVVVAFARMLSDGDRLGLDTSAMVSQYLVNPLKWMVPALLFYDGCRTRERLRLGLFAVIGVYALIAAQTIRLIPPQHVLDAAELERRSRKILEMEVGYHRIDISMMLAGASWAALAVREALASRRLRLAMALLAVAIVYGQALTAGRAGYATWAVVGLVLCTLRWRRYLLVAPLLVAGILWAVPGAAGRMMQGVSVEETLEDADQIDEAEVTAGRTVIWPYVIEAIGEAPVFGYGRQAMKRTGLAEFLREYLGEGFVHPHNAYLEMLLDAGWVGLCLVLPIYLLAVGHGLRLFRDRSPWCVAAGGAGLALVLALLCASVGAQTLYPREGTVGMWCAVGLLFRMAVERDRRSSAFFGDRRPGGTASPRPGALPAPAVVRAG